MNSFLLPLSHHYPYFALGKGRRDSLAMLLLDQLTPEEYNLFFGDLKRDPLFYLVRPSLLPQQVAGHSGAKLLKISYADTSVEVVVFPSETLLAPHIQTGGITVGGETIAYTPDSCHYRFSNQTVIVSVNDCHPRSLDGVILTESHVGIFHPVPQRLLHLLHEDHQNSSSLQDNMCDYHIFHLADKSSLPVPLRVKRSIDKRFEDLEDEYLCATDDEHDMTGRASTRDERILKTPSIRTLDELVPDLEEDLNMNRNVTVPRTEDEDEVSRVPISIVKKKTIELAVFCDDVLYSNFPQKLKDSKSTRLFDYILTLVNAIQGIYHQEELQGYVLDLLIVKLDIQTSPNQGPRKSGGDIGAYLSSFCDWQKARNPSGEETPEHWDHAIMLSGLDLHSSGNPSVIGLAWVSGMCRPSISCTMNEGRSFMAVYVVAHEMGHNLGMNHDGHGEASGCNSGKYIMSPSVGPGKTTWSQCSIEVIHKFLRLSKYFNLINYIPRRSTCLDDGAEARAELRVDTSTLPFSEAQLISAKGVHSPLPPFLKALRDRTPGHRFTLTEQCQAMHGRDYFPALTKIDLCEYLYCTNGVLTKPAHPALEGSPCGPHRICLGGKCRPEEELSRFVHLYGGIATGAVGHVTEPETETPPYEEDLPFMTISDDKEDACTCTELPKVTEKPPKVICPLLAPAFYPVSDCEEQCSREDIFIKFENGYFYQIVNGEEKGESGVCNIVDHILSTTDVHESLLEDFNGLGISKRDYQLLCSVMPEFVSSVLPCSQTIDVGRCTPQRITLGIYGYNFTYIEENSYQNKNKIKWKGRRYSLFEFSGDQKLESSLRELFDGDILSQFSKCKQDNEFTKLSQISLTEIRPYLPYSLQPFFNANILNEVCQTKSMIFLDSKSKLATRVPIRTIDESKLSRCNRCPEVYKDLDNILTSLMNISDEVLVKICHLIPSAWVESVKACETAYLSEFSDDNCPPNYLVVQGNRFDFTYSLRGANERGISETSIEWRGHPYFLKEINYAGKQTEEVLEAKYNVDFSKKSTFRYYQSELKTRPRVSKYRSNSEGDSPTVLKSLNTQGDLKDELNFGVNGTLEKMDNLQEYIGQRDAYLASNAALVMPRTYVGPCSVTCGKGVRTINVECVDVTTEEVVDDGTCQGFVDTEINMEPCVMPPCSTARWTIEDWGPCSESCGSGIQYRDVICAIRLPVDPSDATQLRGDIEIVVDGSQCSGKQPSRVKECIGQCKLPVWCTNDDCLDYQDVQISKDFDY
ncbi:A disintegrin and metalloproteinase with thrombospondin motifs 20-like [Palaemon carinicauda]|uniref:A disintegrin and metalloproteinase with thrombospondin motifs 20-like n=1 Tax=Palaemon carinicauda TaxID=392227 RepID=UPI0035B5B268